MNRQIDCRFNTKSLIPKINGIQSNLNPKWMLSWPDDTKCGSFSKWDRHFTNCYTGPIFKRRRRTAHNRSALPKKGSTIFDCTSTARTCTMQILLLQLQTLFLMALHNIIREHVQYFEGKTMVLLFSRSSKTTTTQSRHRMISRFLIFHWK